MSLFWHIYNLTLYFFSVFRNDGGKVTVSPIGKYFVVVVFALLFFFPDVNAVWISHFEGQISVDSVFMDKCQASLNTMKALHSN